MRRSREMGRLLGIMVVVMGPLFCSAWFMPPPAQQPQQRAHPPSAAGTGLGSSSSSRRDVVLGQGGVMAAAAALGLLLPFSPAPQAARAASEEEKAAEIQTALDTLRVELERGVNLGKLETALGARDWDTLKKYSREYDAYLRGELMGKAKKAMADKKAAQSLREGTMYSLIGVSKGARQQDAALVADSLKEVKELLAQFLALERATTTTAAPSSS